MGSRERLSKHHEGIERSRGFPFLSARWAATGRAYSWPPVRPLPLFLWHTESLSLSLPVPQPGALSVAGHTVCQSRFRTSKILHLTGAFGSAHRTRLNPLASRACSRAQAPSNRDCVLARPGQLRASSPTSSERASPVGSADATPDEPPGMSGCAAARGPLSAPNLQLDLAFSEPAAESAFRAHAAAANRRTAVLSAAMRLVAWCLIAVRLEAAGAGDHPGALLAALCAASDGALLVMHARRCAARPCMKDVPPG